MAIEPITIGRRKVGPGHPVYMVAEISANHHQSFDEAERLVRAAKDAGADAVKLQTYTSETLTIDCDKPEFQISDGTAWASRSMHDLYDEACTPWEWHEPLAHLAAQLGIEFFSSPFDATAVDFLEEMDVPCFKIASFEIVDLELIRKAAATGKPLILSTGLADDQEIADALASARDAGARQIAILKCTSAYPASPDDMNLRTIPDMVERFGVPVGLSDHTLGATVPVAAVALGVCIIEKHLTLSRKVPGPDSMFSMEPDEFSQMISEIREAERALGHVHYGPTAAEENFREFRRSLFVVKDVKMGEPFTEDNVRSIRPGQGLKPKHLPEVLGGKASRDIVRGTPMAWDLVADQ